MLPPFIHVQNLNDWQDCLEELRRAPRLAIDLESNSMYVYQEYICLIQISTATQDYIIDPLQDLDLSPLGEILADPDVEKVFHAGEYDLMLMRREHNWQVNNMFDTMLAARTLGYKKIGLASLMDEIFDVILDKKYQRANWGERPLRAPQLAYAQCDTHYLFQLRDYLLDRLAEKDRLAEAEELFVRQTHVQPADNSFDPDGFWYLGGVRKLPTQALARLKVLYILRDELAAKMDRPLFKVIGNKQLLEMAEYPPENHNDLSSIRGLSYQIVRREGQRLLHVLRQAKNDPIPLRPQGPPRPSDAVMNRFETLQVWRKERAIKREVESDVILSKDALWALARQNPQTASELADLSAVIGTIRLGLYGTEILSVLTK